MAEDITQRELLKAISSQGEAIKSLAGEVRNSTEITQRGFQSMERLLSSQSTVTSKINGAGPMIVQTIAMIGIIASLMFGLLAPVNQSIQHATQAVEKHASLASHPEAIHDLATFRESFREVETQLGAVSAQSKTRHDGQQRQLDEIKSWFRPPALRNGSALN